MSRAALRSLCAVAAACALAGLAPAAARAQLVTRVTAPEGATGIAAHDYLERVVSTSPELERARTLALAVEARIDEARVLPSPHLRGGVGVLDVSGASAPTETFVALSVPVDYAGRTGTRIDAAFAEREVARAELAATERELRVRALGLYVDALAAAARAATLAGEVTLHEEIARAIARRAEVGEASPLEAALATLAAARTRADLAAAEGEARAARVAMTALVGGSGGREALAPEGDLAVPPRTLAFDALLESALSSRPEALVARLGVLARERDLDAVHRSRWPEVEVEVGWLHSFASLGSLFNQPEFDALTVALDVELPLYLAWDGSLRAADAELAAAEAGVVATELAVRIEVESALARYEAARDALVALTRGPVPEAARLESLVSTAFERGESDVLALLAAREHLRELDQRSIEALAEHARALAEVLVASGSDESPF